MQPKRVTEDRTTRNPHIPGSISRKRDAFFGGTQTEVVCADKHTHEYLNSGVPEDAMPSPVYSACPVCGKAQSNLIGTIGIKCEECRWDAFMEQVVKSEAKEGVTLYPRRDDPAEARARIGYRDRRSYFVPS